MREIKFRAWDETDKCWNYMQLTQGSVSQTTYANFTTSNNHRNWSNWMQFTGLKDKNGKEIYEDDVVRLAKFDDGLLTRKVYIDKWGVFPFRETTFSGEGGAEVIGNIYENPDLLKL